jgi:hypothetical protein
VPRTEHQQLCTTQRSFSAIQIDKLGCHQDEIVKHTAGERATELPANQKDHQNQQQPPKPSPSPFQPGI